MCKYLDCPFMVSHADTGAACICVVYLYWVLCLFYVCCLFVRYVYVYVWLPWLRVRGLSCWHWCCGASRRAWWCWRGAGRSYPETRHSPPRPHPHCPTNLWPTKTSKLKPVTDKNMNVKTCADKNSHYIHAFNKPQVIKIHFLPQNSNKVYRLYSELANIFPGHQKPCLRKVFDN